VREGKYALRALVKQGDDPINASGNRNELLQYTDEPSGSEYWYSWSTMFDANFPSPNTWQLFLQWHHNGNSGSPPVEFCVEDGYIELVVQSTTIWRTPLVRSVWHDFVFHVKWSSDRTVGFVELWHNGELVLPKKMVATQFSGMTNYLKMGLYRDDSISQDGIVWHDNFIMATSKADVLPAVAQPTPTPTPTPEPTPGTPSPTPAPEPTQPGSGTSPTPYPKPTPSSPWSSTQPTSGSGCGGGIAGMLTMLAAGLARMLGKG
jgi:hypothetical protein